MKKEEGDKRNQEDNAVSKQRPVTSNKLHSPSHGVDVIRDTPAL